ncbi:MAG: LysM peptidoglycan-binding domain-containing protein [Lachnospiraceae bacterium]|nr:LysM peptidoglycan-binding domain-containing protein [Lachnospiraceae bacterium]
MMNINQRRFCFTVLTAALIAAFAVFGSMTLFTSAESDKKPVEGKYYVSYEIQSGDSLWSIASSMCRDHNVSEKEYIREVKQVNHMHTDRLLEGKSLIIIKYQ